MLFKSYILVFFEVKMLPLCRAFLFILVVSLILIKKAHWSGIFIII